ncbi:MAG: pirin family protein [Phycisphaerales bacterium JB050]
MLTIRKREERGRTRLNWLDGKHSFSFGRYVDREHMGFRSLRVINDDVVAPGGGFGMHPHEEMEILTFVMEGALEHADSTGGGAVIHPGDVQRMSAGTGIRHSEFNASKTDPVRLLQVWIMPGTPGVEPGYEQIAAVEIDRDDRLALVASPEGGEGAVKIHADARVYSARLSGGAGVKHEIRGGRGVWVQVYTGSVEVGGQTLRDGDGFAIEDEAQIEITGGPDGGSFLLFDLA